jgi:hypothetical protein
MCAAWRRILNLSISKKLSFMQQSETGGCLMNLFTISTSNLQLVCNSAKRTAYLRKLLYSFAIFCM